MMGVPTCRKLRTSAAELCSRTLDCTQGPFQIRMRLVISNQSCPIWLDTVQPQTYIAGRKAWQHCVHLCHLVVTMLGIHLSEASGCLLLLRKQAVYFVYCTDIIPSFKLN